MSSYEQDAKMGSDGCQVTDLTSCVCSCKTLKHSKSLSEAENRKELNAIKDLLMDMKNEIKTILQK